MRFRCSTLSLGTKMFAISSRVSKAQKISTFIAITSKKLTCLTNNYCFLPRNQKVCVNVYMIKFELVWKGKYFTYGLLKKGPILRNSREKIVGQISKYGF